MSDAKTTTASLYIEVFVECPYCGHPLDLMNPEDTSGRYLNEEGQVLSQACPEGSWHEKHKDFSVNDVECSSCEETFNVKGLEW